MASARTLKRRRQRQEAKKPKRPSKFMTPEWAFREAVDIWKQNLKMVELFDRPFERDGEGRAIVRFRHD